MLNSRPLQLFLHSLQAFSTHILEAAEPRPRTLPHLQSGVRLDLTVPLTGGPGSSDLCCCIHWRRECIIHLCDIETLVMFGRVLPPQLRKGRQLALRISLKNP